jgi:hypothetical protein
LHLSRIDGSPLLSRLEILHRWIASLAKSGINPLHDDIVDFAALVTLAEAPLIDAENLFRQPGPPLGIRFHFSLLA